MKKSTLLLALLSFLTVQSLFAKTERVTDYKESFEEPNTTKNRDFEPPRGWGRIADYTSSNYAAYSWEATGGQSGAYIKVGSHPATLNDLIVTPRMPGEATFSFYVKADPMMSYSSKLQLFICEKQDDGSFTRVGEITYANLPRLTTSWQKVSVTLNEDDRVYVGFRLAYAYLDEFETETVWIEKSNDMKVTAVDPTGNVSVDSDATGNFTVSLTATVKNSGDFLLSKEKSAPNDDDEEGYDYSLSLIEHETGTEILKKEIYGPLDLNETAEEALSAVLNLTDYPEGIKVDVRENVTGKVVEGPSFSIVPYEPIPVFTRKGSTTSLGAGSTDYFGVSSDEVTRSFSLRNDGAAMMPVTAIDLPEGYAFAEDITFPLEIAAHATSDFGVKMEASLQGDKVGIMKIGIDGADDISISLHGAVTGDEVWYEGFESGSVPADYINTWAVSDLNSAHGLSWNKKVLMNGVANATRLITPMFEAEEGDAVHFSAAITATNSPYLKVYHSADRKNWTLLKELSIDSEDEEYALANETLVGNNGVFRRYAVELPAGRGYLQFEGSRMLLDDIVGPTLIEQDHDLFFESLEAPADGMVNYNTRMTVGVRNVTANEEPAAGYTLSFYVDGELMDTAESSDFAPNELKQFSFDYTPHAVGEKALEFKIATTDGYQNTIAAVLKVAEETSEVSGTFSGNVTFEADGGPAAGVAVKAEHENVYYVTATAADGSFTLPILQTGFDYNLTLVLEGYMPEVRTINVSDGSLEENFTLKEADRVALLFTEIPTEGTVNNPLVAKVNVINPTTEAISDYRVVVYLDGKESAEAETGALAPGEEASFDIEFYPHADGMVPAYVAAVTDGKVCESETVDIEVAPEVGSKTLQVGTPASNLTDMFSYMMNKNVIYEWYYTPEQIGLDKGTKIHSLTLHGYSSSNLTVDAGLYLTNESEIAFAANGQNPISEMTKVCSLSAYAVEKAGSSTAKVDVMTFKFDEPFVYEGESLHFVLTNTGNVLSSPLYIEMDATVNAQSATGVTSFETAVPSSWIKSKRVPVGYFLVDDFLTVSGVVDAEDAEAVEGATVSLVSGGVLYSATTDEAGEYSMDVIQKNLEYTAVVTAPGYVVYKEDNVSFGINDFTLVKNIEFDPSQLTTIVVPVDINAAEIESYGVFYELTSFDAEKDRLEFRVAEETFTGQPYLFQAASATPFDFASFEIADIDAGSSVANGALFKGSYSVCPIVTDEETVSFIFDAGEGKFVRVADEEMFCPQFQAYLSVPEALAGSIDEIPVTFEVVNSVEAVESVREGYRVYNLQGILLLDTKDENAVKSLGTGLYIVNGKKVYIRK